MYQAHAYLDMPEGKGLLQKHPLVVGECFTRSPVPMHDDVKKTFLMSFSRGELQMTVDVATDVRSCSKFSRRSHCFQMFFLGETTKIHVRINNQSAKQVRSIKAKLVSVTSVKTGRTAAKEMKGIYSVQYPHTVEAGGVFEGDLDFTAPLDVYPSSSGEFASNTRAIFACRPLLRLIHGRPFCCRVRCAHGARSPGMLRRHACAPSRGRAAANHHI